MNELIKNETKGNLQIVGGTHEEKVMLFNAMNNAESLSEHVGQEILCKGYFVQDNIREDEETGEVKNGVIITLIDIDNNAYATNSKSFLDGLKQATLLFGEDWSENPLIIVPIQKRSKSGNKYLTLAVK